MFYVVLSALLSFQDDTELIARLKRREPQAMAELYDRFGKVAFTVIARIVKNAAIAEELLQETYIKIWNQVDGFDEGRGNLGPWVLAVARNRAVDYLRSNDIQLTQTSSNLKALERPQLFTHFEADYYNMDRVRLIREAFTKLTDHQREILELAYFEGLSQSEIAARLDQPLGTIETWVQTALQSLRGELKEVPHRS